MFYGWDNLKEIINKQINISKSKDNLISTQNDAIKMYEEQIGQYKRTKEDYGLSLNKYIVYLHN